MKGESSYFGFAKETSYADAKAPSTFWKLLKLTPNIGRDIQRRFRIAGSAQQSEVVQKAWNQKAEIGTTADPNVTGQLLYSLFGKVTTTAIPEAPTNPATDTLEQSALAGDKHLHLVDSTGFAINDWVAIGTGATCEFAKITAINGNDLTITAEGTDGGLVYGHSSGASVTENLTPVYKHEFTEVGDLPSYTWEIDLGTPDDSGAQRLTGMTAESVGFSWQSMEPINVNASFSGSKASIHNDRSIPVYDEIISFPTSNTTVNFDGTEKSGSITSMKLDLSNGLEGNERTLQSGVFATKGVPGGISATFEAEALFESDVDLQRFLGGSGSNYEVQQTTLPFSCVIETTGDHIGTSTQHSSLKFTMPNAYMSACSVPVEIGKRMAQSWKTMAIYDETAGYAVKIELVCGKSGF
jgi:hypothetical protein